MHVCRPAALSACLLLLLTACGGGGGAGGSAVGPGPVEPLAGVSLPLPSGHGLMAGSVSVAPGGSAEHGNVVVSCPASGQTCVVTVAADGTASYDRAGGMPGVMAAYGAWALPPGHGLSAGTLRVAPGGSAEHGNVVVSCPASGQACVVTVAADGTASYDRTGGVMVAEPVLREPFDTVSVRLAKETGNPTSAELLSYLSTQLGGGPWYAGSQYMWSDIPGLGRYSSPPMVRIVQGASAHERAMVHHAVALINRELPNQWHIQIGSDAPTLGAVSAVPDGELYVGFLAAAEYELSGGGRPESEGLAFPDRVSEWDERQQRHEVKGMRAAQVWMRPETWFRSNQRSEGNMMWVLVHELIHALGLHGHVPEGEHPGSIMNDCCQQSSIERIPEIDGTALRAIYTRYENGTGSEDLSPESLGPWETNSLNLSGELDTPGGTVSFGVKHRNGISVPWTSGQEPSSALADNRSITGTATWSGGLLGFTPHQLSVGGNAEINVNMGTMNGSADFTDLQRWPAGQAPGALGTGSQWGEGSLGYTISVSGNFLRSTGGDAGVVAGNFYGSGHEGVAGSLERSDLTAVFGAKHQSTSDVR